ncbi:MAG: hypothetical protein E7044_13865 [Lentisphaerae bacterium]|nr:hypothetical protein [Lentisphaerota bacterium]
MKKSSLRICRFTLLELVLILICVSIGTFLLRAAFELKSPKAVQCTANLMAIGKAVEAYRADNDEYFMIPQRKVKNKGYCPPNWATLLACPKLGNYLAPAKLNCPEMPVYLPERWSSPKACENPYSWMWNKPGYGYNAIWVGGARRGHGYQDAKPYTSAAVEEPEKLIVIADSADSDRKTGGAFLWPAYGKKTTVLWPRHEGAVNVLYADGHVAATASGMNKASEEASQALYAKGAELESSVTGKKMTCKWRMGLD